MMPADFVAAEDWFVTQAVSSYTPADAGWNAPPVNDDTKVKIERAVRALCAYDRNNPETVVALSDDRPGRRAARLRDKRRRKEMRAVVAGALGTSVAMLLLQWALSALVNWIIEHYINQQIADPTTAARMVGLPGV